MYLNGCVVFVLQVVEGKQEREVWGVVLHGESFVESEDEGAVRNWGKEGWL